MCLLSLLLSLTYRAHPKPHRKTSVCVKMTARREVVQNILVVVTAEDMLRLILCDRHVHWVAADVAVITLTKQ